MESADLYQPRAVKNSPPSMDMKSSDVRNGRRRSKSEGVDSDLIRHLEHGYIGEGRRPLGRVRLPSPGRKPSYGADGRDIDRCNCTLPRHHPNFCGRPFINRKMSGQSLSPCRENLTPGNGVTYAKEHFRSPHRSPLRDPDNCTPIKTIPPALTENGRHKYSGDWNVYRNGVNGDHALMNGRLNGVSLLHPPNVKSWSDAESGDSAAAQCRMWKGSVSDHGTNRMDGVEERYLREVEALRSQLLQLDQLRNSVDGKRLRQRSESETNGGCCGPDYRHSACVGKEPKRARDYRCASPFQRSESGAGSREEAGCRYHGSEQANWSQENADSQGSSALSGSYQTEEASSAVSCASSCGEETEPDRAFVRTSETDSLTPRTSAVESSFSSKTNTVSSVESSANPSGAAENALAEPSAGDAAVKPKPKGKKYVEHPGPHSLDGLRPSLFSNVPPYVRFVMHDEKGQPLPPSIQRYLKWNLSNITPIVVRRTVSNSGYRLVRKSNEWTGTWGKHMKSLHFKLMKDYQKLNHFPGTFQIGRKDRLWKNLFRLITKFGKKEFGFIPRTFVLPQDSKLLRSAWERSTAHEAWIVKPPASARGTGIKVIHRWGHIPKKRPLVVQKYIERPYLINGSKFDLRLYVLVTSVHPLRIYMYDDGLVRFASVKYSGDPASLADRYMHLTNYSINKLSSMYTQNEDASACKGHKWTIKSLWKYLSRYDVDVDALWKRLVDLSIKTIISGESSINQLGRAHLNSRYCCYELFGLDVLFDQDLKPWLLEVNISPSLHSTSPLDLAVKGPMVRDLMNMVGHHVPNKLSPAQQEELIRTYKRFDLQTLCFDKRMYTVTLSAEERTKHILHQQANCREEYLHSILDDLTADDIRHLVQFEDELTQCGRFLKVFPTQHTHEYHQFFESPRYYNMMLDAWETKYHRNRDEGIRLLEDYCKKKVHLQIPIPSGRVKCCMNPPSIPDSRRHPPAPEMEGCKEVAATETWMTTPTESKRMYLANLNTNPNTNPNLNQNSNDNQDLTNESRIRTTATSVLNRAGRSRPHKPRVSVRTSPVCPPGLLSHMRRSTCNAWTNLATNSPHVLDAALDRHNSQGSQRSHDDNADVMVTAACS